MTVDNKTLAQWIRRDAREYANDNRSHDREQRLVIARDVRTLNRVADLVEDGDLRGAYRRWARLDTEVREALRPGTWRALTDGNAIAHTRFDR